MRMLESTDKEFAIFIRSFKLEASPETFRRSQVCLLLYGAKLECKRTQHTVAEQRC